MTGADFMYAGIWGANQDFQLHSKKLLPPRCLTELPRTCPSPHSHLRGLQGFGEGGKVDPHSPILQMMSLRPREALCSAGVRSSDLRLLTLSFGTVPSSTAGQM